MTVSVDGSSPSSMPLQTPPEQFRPWKHISLLTVLPFCISLTQSVHYWAFDLREAATTSHCKLYPRSIAICVRMHNSASDEVEWKCFISECICGVPSSESVFIYQVAELNMCGGNRCGKKLMPPVCFHNVSTDFKSFTQRKDALQWISDHILEEDREPLLIFSLSLSPL